MLLAGLTYLTPAALQPEELQHFAEYRAERLYRGTRRRWKATVFSRTRRNIDRQADINNCGLPKHNASVILPQSITFGRNFGNPYDGVRSASA